MFKYSHPMNQNGVYHLDLAFRIYVNHSSYGTMAKLFFWIEFILLEPMNIELRREIIGLFQSCK